MNHFNEEHPILKHASCGDLDSLRHQLELSGANLHAINDDGDSALMLAAKNGHVAAVRYLIERGAFLFTTNRFGHNALILAAQGCHTEVVRLLMDIGRETGKRSGPSVVALYASHSLDAAGRCPEVGRLLREEC